LLSAAKGAALPDRGDGHLDPADSSPTLDPPTSLVAAAGRHPFSKALRADKDAIPPNRGNDHPDSADSPPALDSSLLASPVAAVRQHPFSKVLRADKGATPPDRGDDHLGAAFLWYSQVFFSCC